MTKPDSTITSQTGEKAFRFLAVTLPVDVLRRGLTDDEKQAVKDIWEYARTDGWRVQVTQMGDQLRVEALPLTPWENR